MKSRIVTLLTSDDVMADRQKLTFKENSDIFARIFTKQWIKIYFSQQDADHVPAGDRARTLMSHIETRAYSLNYFFHICRLS